MELKEHENKKRETKAVEEIVAMVNKMVLEKRMEYITFSLHALKEFIRLAPAGTPVFYLNGDLSPKELKELGCAGLDYHLGVFKKNPGWIKESHDLGMNVNAWTIDKPEDMKWLIISSEIFQYVFQFLHSQLAYLPPQFVVSVQKKKCRCTLYIMHICNIFSLINIDSYQFNNSLFVSMNDRVNPFITM